MLKLTIDPVVIQPRVSAPRRVDPKTHADIVGDSREFADRLGFTWPH
ncbi:hypothetical protein ABGB08_04500 [Acrocarpospora sp. B8E8]